MDGIEEATRDWLSSAPNVSTRVNLGQVAEVAARRRRLLVTMLSMVAAIVLTGTVAIIAKFDATSPAQQVAAQADVSPVRCPSSILQTQNLKTAGGGGPGPMVPAGAASATLCLYAGSNEQPHAEGSLAAESHPDAKRMAALAELLNARPANASRPSSSASVGLTRPVSTSLGPDPEVIHCGPADGRRAVVAFSYPGGRVVVLRIELSGCLTVQNGWLHQSGRNDVAAEINRLASAE